MRDRSIRGRVAHAKFAVEKVNEARRLRQEGWSWRKLGERYGLQVNAVIQAVRGVTWKHATAPVPTNEFSSGRRKGHFGEVD